MRCLGRLGCLALLVVLAIGAWLTRDMWMSKLRRGHAADTSVTRADGWQRVSADGGKRAGAQLRKLQSRTGPAYVNVAPADLASYIMQELATTLPASADSIEAAAIGDRLRVRTTIRTADLGKDVLGPMGALLGERERVEMAGTLRIIRPGFGEFQVKEFRIRQLALPSALIPRLIRQITRGERPPELAPDGLPLQTPPYIGDVRISDGRITLYKAQ